MKARKARCQYCKKKFVIATARQFGHQYSPGGEDYWGEATDPYAVCFRCVEEEGKYFDTLSQEMELMFASKYCHEIGLLQYEPWEA